MVEEKKIVEKLFQKINSHSGLGVYGLKDIMELLKNNVVDTIIITDDTNLHRVEIKCKRCENIMTEIVERPQVYARAARMPPNGHARQ